MNELYYKLAEKMLLVNQGLSIDMEGIKAIKRSTRTELYRRLHYAKDYIDSCYMKQVTLDTIAAVAHLNTAYFLRQFKNYFGITPYQYIIDRRLQEAKKLLEGRPVSVTEVCSSVGYCDVSSFIKLFKKYFSTSPERYQKQFTRQSIAVL